MSRPFLPTLLTGVAFVAITATPAFAQDASAQPSEPATVDTAAQTTEGADAAMIGDEIVVTARRRAENLQDVPISVSAFSGEALENQGAVDITALQQQTPNLTLQIARGSNSTLIAFIRGIGQQDPVWGFEPGVGLYVDDVYVARPQGAVLDIFDVERVEVLRGPQGTLYGRNTIGGAIKYVTRRLGNEFSAKVRGAYGSYNQRDLIGSLTVPVGDTLAIGAAAAMYKRDGFGDNLTTGAEHYNKDVVAGRLSVEFTPTDRIFFRLAADRTEDDSNPRHGTRLLPNGADPRFAPTSSVYDTRAGIGEVNEVVTQGVSGTLEVELNNALTFKSITAYRDGESRTYIDFDGTALPVLDIPANYEDHQFTQELQVLFETDRIQGVAGVYYLKGSASGEFDTVLGTAVPGGLVTATAGDVDTDSIAAFADVSFDVTDKFAVSVGGRYTRDKREGTVFRASYLGLRSPFQGGTQTAPFGAVRTNYTNERTFEEFTPRFSASYKPHDDLTLYASYSKGFKSGGFDPRGDAILVPATVEGYDPEKVDAYEVGLKGAFFDRSLFVNLAGFYSDYKGQQVTIQTVVPPASIASQVDNVGDSRISGIELESRAVLSDELSATFALGYTNADFKRYLALNPLTGQTQDFSDQRAFQNTPKWNGNFALNYVRELGNAGSLAFTPAISFRSDYQLFEIATPTLDQDGYELVDLSLVWTSADKRFQVGGHARNLFDKQYRVGGYNFPGAATGNSVIGFYGPPRTFTISAEVRF